MTVMRKARIASIVPWLAGAIILVTAAVAAVFAFVPLANCPLHSETWINPTNYPCEGCNGMNRVTLSRKWQIARKPDQWWPFVK